MAKRRKKPNQPPPRDDPAAAAKALMATRIRDCAMLLYSPEDTAIELEMTLEAFESMLADPTYGDAWANGRLAVKKSAYTALIAAVRKGDVPAIRLALKLAEANPTPTEDASRAGADDQPLRFAGAFENELAEELRKRAGGGAA